MIRRASRVGFVAAALALTAAGCSSSGSTAQPSPSPSTTVSPSPSPSPAQDLARLAAAARDASYTATYSLQVHKPKRRTEAVKVWVRPKWVRLDILAGGTTTTLIVTPRASFSCRAARHDHACFRVAGAGKPVPQLFDPGLQHAFATYPDQLTRRPGDYSVRSAGTTPAAGSLPAGTCFTVRPDAKAHAPVVHAGTYCFAESGVVTELAYPTGTLRLSRLTGPPTSKAFRPYSSPTPVP